MSQFSWLALDHGLYNTQQVGLAAKKQFDMKSVADYHDKGKRIMRLFIFAKMRSRYLELNECQKHLFSAYMKKPEKFDSPQLSMKGE